MAMGIGKRIQHTRLIQGLTQADLAVKLGVSRSLVAMFETGLALPPVEQVTKLNDVFGVDLNSTETDAAFSYLQGAGK